MYGIDSLLTEMGTGATFSNGLVVLASTIALGALSCSFVYLYRLLRAVEHVAVRLVSPSGSQSSAGDAERSRPGFEPEPLPFDPSGLPFEVADAAMGGSCFAPFEADFMETSGANCTEGSSAEFDAEFDAVFDAEFGDDAAPPAAPVREGEVLFEDDAADVEQEMGILRQGVLTINFVQMSRQFQSKAQESVIEPTLEQVAYGDGPLAKFRVHEIEVEPTLDQADAEEVSEENSDLPRSGSGNFYLMEHMAVLSTQFDDLRRIVSVTEVSPQPGSNVEMAGEEAVADKLRRLERIEEASIEMAAFSQAAGALGAQIDLLQLECGEDDPKLAPRYLRLAELHLALGKPEQAERCQLRALEVQGKAAPATSSSDVPTRAIEDPLTDVEIQEFSASMGSLGQHLWNLSPTDVEPSEQARQHPPRP